MGEFAKVLFGSVPLDNSIMKFNMHINCGQENLATPDSISSLEDIDKLSTLSIAILPPPSPTVKILYT